MLDLDALGFRPDGAYAGGEVGARRLVDGEGRRHVLKLQPPGLAPATCGRLRALGYPAPRYVAWGEDWVVYEELPGAPAGGWGDPAAALGARLVELNELQAGCAVDADDGWPAIVVESVQRGLDGYAVTETLERHSDESRELLRRCRRAVDRGAGALGGARDVVHWDFTPGNVLVERGRVSGVIDWGGTRAGDRLFDLATLVYYARGGLPALEEYVVERIGRAGLAVYLAHMAVRQADWSLRRHADGDAVVEYSLGLLGRVGA